MATATTALNPITKTYWEALKNVGQDVKLELISLLAASLTTKTKQNEENNWAQKYCGAWQDDKSPEEMAAFIRNSRYTGTRKIMPLD